MTVPAASLTEALFQGATPPVGTGATAPPTPFTAVIATLLGGAPETGPLAATLAPGEDNGSSALGPGLAFGHTLPAGSAGAEGVLGLLGQPADWAVPGALPSPAAAPTASPGQDAPAGLPPFAPAPGLAAAAAPNSAVPGALPSPGIAAGGDINPFDPAAAPTVSPGQNAPAGLPPFAPGQDAPAGLPPFAPAPGLANAAVPAPAAHSPAAPASEGAASRVPVAPIAPGGVAAPGTPASPPATQAPDGSNEASAATAATALRALNAGRHAALPAPPGPADETAFSRGAAPAPPVRVQYEAAPPAATAGPPRPSARLSGEAALATTAAAGPNPPSTTPGATVANAAAAMADAGETTPHPNGAARGAADGVIPPSTGALPEFTRGDPNAAADTSHPATQSHVLGDARFGAVNTAPQQPAQATSGGAPVTDPNPVPPREVAEQVTLQLRSSLRSGADRITIQLRPAALGTIDIRLDVAHDGRVTAVISADRSDTLDLLQRDARGIERALHDAGLRTDSGSLSFNLRGDGRHQALADADPGAGAGPHPDDAGPGEPNGPEDDRASASNHVLDIEV